MELKSYFYKRTLRDTHSDYGVVADGVEECPIGIVKRIGYSCTLKPCCKGSAPYMSIVENITSWVMCEETTRMMNEDPTLGLQSTCVINEKRAP